MQDIKEDYFDKDGNKLSLDSEQLEVINAAKSYIEDARAKSLRGLYNSSDLTVDDLLMLEIGSESGDEDQIPSVFCSQFDYAMSLVENRASIREILAYFVEIGADISNLDSKQLHILIDSDKEDDSVAYKGNKTALHILKSPYYERLVKKLSYLDHEILAEQAAKELLKKPEARDYAKSLDRLIDDEDSAILARYYVISNTKTPEEADKYMAEALPTLPLEHRKELALVLMKRKRCDLLKKAGFDFNQSYKDNSSFIKELIEDREIETDQVRLLIKSGATVTKADIESGLKLGLTDLIKSLFENATPEVKRSVDFSFWSRQAIKNEMYYTYRPERIEKLFSIFNQIHEVGRHDFINEVFHDPEIIKILTRLVENENPDDRKNPLALKKFMAEPFFPVELRLMFKDRFAPDYENLVKAGRTNNKDADGKVIKLPARFEREIPSPDKTGGAGKPYRYMAASAAIEVLQGMLGPQKSNKLLNSILKQTGGDWPEIQKKAQASAGLIKDTVNEVSKHLAASYVAMAIPAFVLKKMSAGSVQGAINATSKVLFNYICKNKSLDNLSSLSDLWHLRRGTILDLMRDFVPEGQWYPLFKQKEFEVPLDKARSGKEALCIINITDADALTTEGKVMDHCVGGRVDDCLSAKSHIFSIKTESGFAVSTFEIVPSTNGDIKINGESYKIAEHQGRSNENLPPEAEKALEWFLGQIKQKAFTVNDKHGEIETVAKRLHIENKIGLELPKSQAEREEFVQRIEKNFQIIGSNVEGAPKLHVNRNNGGYFIPREDRNTTLHSLMKKLGIEDALAASTRQHMQDSKSQEGPAAGAATR